MRKNILAVFAVAALLAASAMAHGPPVPVPCSISVSVALTAPTVSLSQLEGDGLGMVATRNRSNSDPERMKTFFCYIGTSKATVTAGAKNVGGSGGIKAVRIPDGDGIISVPVTQGAPPGDVSPVSI